MCFQVSVKSTNDATFPSFNPGNKELPDCSVKFLPNHFKKCQPGTFRKSGNDSFLPVESSVASYVN